MLSGKKKPMILNLDFSTRNHGTLTGNGSDDILGFFNLNGTWSEKAPYPVEFSFQFPSNGSAKMEFTGWRESDKGGIFGTWKGNQGSGSYAFAPSKEATEAAKKLEESAKNQTKTQLLSMGFPEWLVEQALLETKGLEPAVNWITQQLDSGPTTEKVSSNPSSPSSESVDPTKLSNLVSMGFEEEMAKDALIKSGGDVEGAANWLFDHM